MIQGGWEFVWAAYGIVWTSLTVYGVSLVLRRRSLENAAPPAPEVNQ